MNLKKYLGRHRGMVALITILLAIAEIGTAAGSTILSKDIDTLMRHDAIGFSRWFGLSIVLTVLTLGSTLVSTYLKTVNIQTMNIDLQQDLATGIGNLPYDKFHRDNTVGRFTSWLNNDVSQLDEKGFTNFYDLVSNGVGIVASLIALYLFHWSLVVVALLLALIINLVPRLIKQALVNSSREVTERLEKFNTQVENVLHGFDTLLAFRRKHELVQQTLVAGKSVRDANVKYKVREVQIDALTGVVIIACDVALIVWIALLVHQGKITAGALMAALQLGGMIFGQFGDFSAGLVKAKAVQPIFAKYHELDIVAPAPLEFRNQHVSDLQLTKVASGTAGAWLHEISAQIPATSKVHIAGPSGAGKSTLLRIITGLTSDYQGQVQWTPNADPNVLYLPQAPYVFNETIRYNLTLGRPISDDDLWAALEKVQLKTLVQNLPDQLATRLTAGGADLSGGERQRLALARGLLLQPAVLLFDESTSNVDGATALAIEQEILQNPAQTVLFVSHNQRPELEPLFDQTLTLTND